MLQTLFYVNLSIDFVMVKLCPGRSSGIKVGSKFEFWFETRARNKMSSKSKTIM